MSMGGRTVTTAMILALSGCTLLLEPLRPVDAGADAAVDDGDVTSDAAGDGDVLRGDADRDQAADGGEEPDGDECGTVDTDGDGVGDPCDPCPLDPLDDSDGDGICDSSDQCPGHDDGADRDGDGNPDDCDVCDFDGPMSPVIPDAVTGVDGVVTVRNVAINSGGNVAIVAPNAPFTVALEVLITWDCDEEEQSYVLENGLVPSSTWHECMPLNESSCENWSYEGPMGFNAPAAQGEYHLRFHLVAHSHCSTDGSWVAGEPPEANTYGVICVL